MAANGLDAYSVSVRLLRDKTFKMLGSFHGKASLNDVIYDILKKAEQYHHDLHLYRKCVTFSDVKKVETRLRASRIPAITDSAIN